jgi:hypothetical protein
VGERYAVKLSARAAASLDDLPRQDRGRLIINLRRLALGGRVPGGMFTVAAWRHLAACEASPRARTVLVYAVVEWNALYRELVGERVAREAAAAAGRRSMRRSAS